MIDNLTSDEEAIRRVVINIYDDYTNALAFNKYNAQRLATYRRWNLCLDIVVALGASSVVGSWAIWQSEAGAPFWAIVAGVAAALAILAPILQLPKSIEKY